MTVSKTMIRRLAIIVLATALMMSMTISAFASEEASATIPPSTAEEKAILAQKLATMNALLANEPITRVAQATSTVSLNVPAYKQEKTYWCGPATVKEVVQYHKGSSSSQATYASLLGTTTNGTVFKNVATVLKSKTGKNYVYGALATSLLQWQTIVASDLSTWKMATVMDIKSPDNIKWKYPTDGHILPIRKMEWTGTVRSISHVTMSDPHFKYYTPNYTETAERAHAVNHAHPQHAMVF